MTSSPALSALPAPSLAPGPVARPRLRRRPVIFAANYFLKDKSGNYITGMTDKRVWVKWMELRCHHDVEALITPAGFIPLYTDLQRLFKEVLGREYAEADYAEQFKLRVIENLQKIERIERIWRTDVTDAPEALFEQLAAQRQRLETAKTQFGDTIPPFEFAQTK